LICDLEAAWSRARFVTGQFIPGSIESAVSAGVTVRDLGPVSAGVFLRYFGPRPLT